MLAPVVLVIYSPALRYADELQAKLNEERLASEIVIAE